MAHWVLKTEPSTYSFDDLVRAGTARWDGVTNPVALRNIKAMTKDDQVAIYHTGAEKAVVGTATVVSAPYADPKDSKLTVVDLKAGRKLAPVTLAEIRGMDEFGDSPLVRQPRLSVIPATPEQWVRLTG
ncbi:MAG TPA: EVE domain-containing protein [Gemmatimonadales bacterium]|jgi:predicted RNA-binding protein with PUA-like domain